MPGPLSKAPPPPPSPAVLAQRRKQKWLIVGTVLGLLTVLIAWQTYEYIASAPQRADAKVQAGIALLRPGSYKQAVEEFTRALEIDPASWNAYLQRGIAHQNLGELNEALDDFQGALDRKPDTLEALIARASIFGEKGDTRKTIEELTKVIALKPNVDAYYRRASARASLGQHKEAIEDFTWVIDEVRDAPYAYFGRANSKQAIGDLAGAEQDRIAAQGFDRKIQ